MADNKFTLREILTTNPKKVTKHLSMRIQWILVK
jgi:hypothetical protein